MREWDLLTMTSVRVLQGHKGPIRDVKVRIFLVVPCFLSLSILPQWRRRAVNLVVNLHTCKGTHGHGH